MDPIVFYKCLADDTRLKSVLLIDREHELCVCELTEGLQVSQPKVSRHLAQLRACGLLVDRRDGQWIFYRINPEIPVWATEVIRATANSNPDIIKEAYQLLCGMGDRPVRREHCC